MDTKNIVEVEISESRSGDGNGNGRASEVEVALASTIRELLRDHRALLERILAGGPTAIVAPPAGTSVELIAQYRAIRRALALPDDQPDAVVDARGPTSSTSAS